MEKSKDNGIDMDAELKAATKAMEAARREFSTPALDDDGTYTDEQGRVWTVYLAEAENADADPTTIANNMPEDAETLEGLNRGLSPTVFHLQKDMQAAVAHLTEIPGHRRLIEEDDIYTVPKSGRRYATMKRAAKELRMSDIPIKDAVKKGRVRKLIARHPQNGRLVLVCIEDLLQDETIKAKVNATVVVDKKGHYRDETFGSDPEDPDKGLWCTADTFWADHVSEETKAKTCRTAVARQARRQCESKEAVDTKGRPGKRIYRLSDLKTKALALVNHGIRVDEKTKFYTDENGIRWATKQTWMPEMGVTKFALNKGLELIYGTDDWAAVPRIKGIGQSGREDWLYSEAEIRKLLSYLLNAEVLIIDGIFQLMDETREKVAVVYYTANRLQREVPLATSNIHRRLQEEGCPRLEGIDRKSGAVLAVYEVERAREIFNDQINVVVSTDANGEETNPHYGRCMTIQQFREKHPSLSRRTVDRYVERAERGGCITALKRRHASLNRIVTLYPEKDLKRLLRDFLAT